MMKHKEESLFDNTLALHRNNYGKNDCILEDLLYTSLQRDIKTKIHSELHLELRLFLLVKLY